MWHYTQTLDFLKFLGRTVLKWFSRNGTFMILYGPKSHSHVELKGNAHSRNLNILGTFYGLEVKWYGVSPGTFLPSKQDGQIQTVNGCWHMQLPGQCSSYLGDCCLAQTMPAAVLKFKQCGQSQAITHSHSGTVLFTCIDITNETALAIQSHFL